jgi:phage tail sheath protein FI
MAYTRPGVFVTESPLRNNVVRANNSVAVAAFIGTSNRGPSTPTLVDSWASYRSAFGDIAQEHDLGFAVYHYFANGGRVAYVSRLVGASATSATTASVAYTANASVSAVSLMTVSAKDAGTWGNSLTLAVSNGKAPKSATLLPTFNINVSLNGTNVESWSELSADPASSRYVDTVINGYSSYITVSNVATVTPNINFSYSIGTYTLSGGGNGAALTQSNYQAACTLLNQVEGNLILNFPDVTDATLVKEGLNYCASRGNSFMIIDPIANVSTYSDITGAISGYSSATNLGYGAVYYPQLKMVDPTKTGPGAIRVTAPGGAIAGCYVRTDTERTVAKTPAGYNVDIRNALGVATPMTDAIVDQVYDLGVNCLKAVPGAGVVVLGGRTLQVLRPDKYISVRRSLNYVKQGAYDISRTAVFEPNNSALWSKLDTQLTKFLTDFWGQGGLKGRTANEAFYVVCDSTNNNSTTIDNGEVHVEIGLALQYPAEFIVINVSQWAGGSNTTETL